MQFNMLHNKYDELLFLFVPLRYMIFWWLFGWLTGKRNLSDKIIKLIAMNTNEKLW